MKHQFKEGPALPPPNPPRSLDEYAKAARESSVDMLTSKYEYGRGLFKFWDDMSEAEREPYIIHARAVLDLAGVQYEEGGQ